MFSATLFYPVRTQWKDYRTYVFAILFAAGNLILPQLCHLVPSGGQIFLPIYFFTLIASYKFGMKVGLATAVLSPLLNAALFSMPPFSVLPVILIKSVLLSVIASNVASHYKKISVFHLLLVVLGYQFIGSLIEWSITQSFDAAKADFTIGIPGVLLQIFIGWFLLKKMASYER
jgi:hypothetical protein